MVERISYQLCTKITSLNHYFDTTGLVGDPTPPVIGNGRDTCKQKFSKLYPAHNRRRVLLN
jgi:hypothetical protein